MHLYDFLTIKMVVFKQGLYTIHMLYLKTWGQGVEKSPSEIEGRMSHNKIQ